MFRDTESDDTENYDTNVGPFKKEKSGYNPPRSNQPALEAFLENIEDDILDTNNWRRTYDNIPKDERSAITELQNDNEITIKPADKGSGVVVMDTNWYINKCEEQLNDSTYYTPLKYDPTTEYLKELEKLVRKWETKKWITHETAIHLIPKEPTPGYFYGLPKIHKQDTPLRPIVPQCNSLTTPLAKFVDHHLQPIVKSLPSYLKDTKHHLQDLDQIKLTNDSLIVTMDVVSLYTNIPHEYGITSVKQALDNYAHNSTHPDLIIDMLKFILTRNYFKFNDKYYLQTHGTAMGSKVAPSYANITMGRLEGDILANYNLNQPTGNVS
ncbi:uncharacterized protein [Ptychodera flava]|uniref:uncharacterized protein n=1 Tax=Ptychodera flava TaxID=63121 RepID=UPI00396A4128